MDNTGALYFPIKLHNHRDKFFVLLLENNQVYMKMLFPAAPLGTIYFDYSHEHSLNDCFGDTFGNFLIILLATPL